MCHENHTILFELILPPLKFIKNPIFAPLKFFIKMSLKRAVSMTFILLANIVLLAHVIIPCQHDHDTIICACLPVDLDMDNEKTHEQPLGADSHQHDDGCPMEDCSSDLDLYIRHKKVKSAIDFCLYGFQQPASFLFSICPIVEITGLEGLPLRQKPYLLTCHTDYITRSLGLRAPPVS